MQERRLKGWAIIENIQKTEIWADVARLDTGGMMPGEKAKDFKGTTRKILSYIGSYKIAIVLVMISAVAGTVFNIVGPKVLSKADNRDIQRSCIKGVRRSGH